LGKIAHHTLGDGVFGNFIELSAKAACCHAVIDPDNCVIEMGRVIGEARKQNQPTYIIVPSETTGARTRLREPISSLSGKRPLVSSC
jgi:indolepyruvate decarboxylase